MKSFMRQSFIKINVRGGILSPGTLKGIIEVARRFRVSNLTFGERQNIYLRTFIDASDLKKNFEYFESFDFELNKNNHPNIVSSYVAEEIFSEANNWLTEGIYKDVLDGFDFKPKLKINIVDNTQGLVPLFIGNLNFISSNQPNFWYLYVSHPSMEGIQSWPELIYTEDIPAIAKALEAELMVNNSLLADLVHLKKLISNTLKINTIPIKEELKLPRLRFPNYEGMNRVGESYWLGIYRRNYDFPVEFLEKVADLCLESKIGSVYLTPFKSLLIKGITESDRFKWEKLLGQYGINIRHNISELNWKIGDLDDDATELKDFLSRQLDSEDVRTYGLTFAIKTDKRDVAASVIIERNYEINLFGKIKLIPNYNIYYVPDFDQNRQDLKLFSSKRPKFFLVDDLMLICRKYYEQLTRNNTASQIEKKEVESEVQNERSLFQCSECFTVYDEDFGDSTSDIASGTTFESLPDTWCCPVCEASKSSFVKKKSDKTKVLA